MKTKAIIAVAINIYRLPDFLIGEKVVFNDLKLL
jgi:hypothetical protein